MSTRVFWERLGIATAALAAAAIVSSLVTGLADDVVHLFFYQTAGFALTLGVVAVAAARRGELNIGVRATTLAATLMALESAGTLTALWIIRHNPGLLEALSRFEAAPADLPLGAALPLWLERTWLLSLGGFLTIGLLLFPNGRLPSPRWRPVAVTSVAALAAYTIANIVEGAPPSTIPFEATDTSTTTGLIKAVTQPVIGILALLSLTSLVVRHRRADSVERHQIRWMLFGAGVFVTSFVIVLIAAALGDTDGANITTAVAMPLLIAAYGVGIVKYRLYDVDLVINKSVVFGALAVFISGVYVAIVVGVGNLVGDPSNLTLAILATAVVAVLFEPVRSRVQHLANVWVYGERATPYEVLAGMTVSDRTPEDQLAEGTRLLAEATGAEAVVTWSGVGDSAYACSTWPSGLRSAVDEVWQMAAPIESNGETIGSVTLEKGPGEAPTAQDRKLLAEFAGQASLLLANIQLNERLRTRLHQITDSRKRLVTAQDATRRKLERDLHDGAQQQLVALKVKLGIARTVAAKEEASQVADLISQISEEADRAVDTLRDLARGIYPPLLEAEGLATAIEGQAGRAPIPVTVHASSLGRYGRDIESAVYFCVLEALANVAKYSGASSAHIRLEEEDGVLSFSIQDDGGGFDPSRPTSGTGIQSMSDRLDTIGGKLAVSSSAGRGTTVSGSVKVARADSPAVSA